MLSVIAESTRADRHIYDQERFVDKIDMMVTKEENTSCLERSSMLGRQEKQQQVDDELGKNMSERLEDSLEKEINMELDGARYQRPPLNALNRSSSVQNMCRRRMMPTFDSERNLSVQEAKNSWCNIDSIHSRASTFDDLRQWHSLDSVHSRVSTAAEPKGGLIGTNSRSSHSDMNDSSCSFASFGDSFDTDSPSNDDDTGDTDVAAILSASRAFTRLQEDPTPYSVLVKQQSMRLKRGASYRGSLSLIQETTLD